MQKSLKIIRNIVFFAAMVILCYYLFLFISHDFRLALLKLKRADIALIGKSIGLDHKEIQTGNDRIALVKLFDLFGLDRERVMSSDKVYVYNRIPKIYILCISSNGTLEHYCCFFN